MFGIYIALVVLGWIALDALGSILAGEEWDPIMRREELPSLDVIDRKAKTVVRQNYVWKG